MVIDRWAAAILLPLVFWILINGIDDLFIAMAWFFLPDDSAKDDASACELQPERRMAIFVPLWKEHHVIEQMVAQNAGSLHYRNYDIFIGCYANDLPTIAAVKEAQSRFPNVHRAQLVHDGPTSKADCLNWIYQHMLLFEEQNGVRFEMILTHDAEDVIHPDSLSCINSYADRYDMVQIPVLALATAWSQLTHGCYCDEFAQFELLDMPVRQMLGGFIPSNGVGTAYSRRILERLTLSYGTCIFEPKCMTEDYENGFRVKLLGGKQFFVPVRESGTGFLATREFFPKKFWTAVRQRTRWTMGIALQSWEMHGVRETIGQAYWFWRDRKSLIGSLVSPLANTLTVFALVRGYPSSSLIGTILAVQAVQIAVRTCCSARIYGWRFAATTPIRMLWGNWISGTATVMAIWIYSSAKLRGEPLRWIKTEHAYPNRAALLDYRKPLEEILVGSGYLTEALLTLALSSKPDGRTLTAHLLKMNVISEGDLYEAISLEQNLPLGKPEDVSETVTRSFPAAMVRKWSVLPFKLVAGHLHVAGSEPPTDEMQADLKLFSSMAIRFQLVTPTKFEELANRYLPTVDSERLECLAG